MLVQGFLGFLLLAGATISPGDTLLAVREGDRLAVREFRGTVVVDSWDRGEVRARIDTKESRGVLFRRNGADVEVLLEQGAHPSHREELFLTVPRWMALELSGREMDVDIRGVDGSVEIWNLTGDMTLADMGGVVEARSVEGSIEASGLNGSAFLRTGDDDISVTASTGAMDLETVDGDIDLADLRAISISARSTDGEITFSGPIPGGSEFAFFTHGGEITLHVTPPADFRASVLSYGGRFESEFPVRASGFRSGESLDFIVGSGGGRVVVETFSGPVRLLRGSGR